MLNDFIVWWSLKKHFQVGKHRKRRRRRKKLKFGKYVKSGAKPRGTVDERRTEQRASAVEKVEEAMQHLPNPFDEMSIDQKKDLALFLCKRRLNCLISRYKINIPFYYSLVEIYSSLIPNLTTSL